MSDILVQLVGSSSGDEIRRKACETDFALFCRTYLPHYFTAEPADYQKEVLEIISRREITPKNEQVLKPLIKSEYHALFKSGKIGGLVDAEPRGFGKSVRLSFAYPLWCLLYRKEVFILIIGASQEAAENQLESIRRELEENELIIDDFGLMQTDKMWSKKKLILANGCAITAKGAGSALRGARYRERRPDLVICDDILKDEAAGSQTQRDKIYSWVKRVLFPLGRDLFLIFVNTIFHSDDLVCRLFSEIKDGSLKDFAGLRFSCLTPSGQSLWPAYWPIDALEKKREELGSRHFNTEYTNEPSTDEEALAKKESLVFFRPADVRPDEMDVISCCDPATGAHDRSAVVTLALHRPTGLIYVLEAFGRRMSDYDYMDKVIRAYEFWRPRRIGWESVNFQVVFKHFLEERARSVGVYLPIEEIRHGSVSKETRISALAPYFESGRILLQENQKELIDEILTFPRGKYDDILDALAMGVAMLTGRKKTRPLVFPVSSRPSPLKTVADALIERFKK